MSEDPWNHPDAKAYVTHVRTHLVPKLMDTDMTISIVPTNPEDVDVKFAVELGLSVMLDKPIILAVHPGTVLPEKLVQVANRIVIGDLHDQSTKDELMSAIQEVGDGL